MGGAQEPGNEARLDLEMSQLFWDLIPQAARGNLEL